MSRKLRIYMAGGMEKEEALGSGWRDRIAPELEKRGYEPLNPIEFEATQLKGFRPKRLPESFVGFDGTIIKPVHWHQLKNAPRGSATLRRFKQYMRCCRNYDVNQIVRGIADIVVCYWTPGTGAGAGSHAECDNTFAVNKPLYIVRGKKADGTFQDVPGWIVGCSSEIFDSFEDLFKYLDDED